jgi:hypothetical protein
MCALTTSRRAPRSPAGPCGSRTTAATCSPLGHRRRRHGAARPSLHRLELPKPTAPESPAPAGKPIEHRHTRGMRWRQRTRARWAAVEVRSEAAPGCGVKIPAGGSFACRSASVAPRTVSAQRWRRRSRLAGQAPQLPLAAAMPPFTVHGGFAHARRRSVANEGGRRSGHRRVVGPVVQSRPMRAGLRSRATRRPLRLKLYVLVRGGALGRDAEAGPKRVCPPIKPARLLLHLRITPISGRGAIC